MTVELNTPTGSVFSGHVDGVELRTTGDFIADAGKNGLKATLKDRWEWARMRMDPTDIADITGHHFTFLMNGLAPDSNWTGILQSLRCLCRRHL